MIRAVLANLIITWTMLAQGSYLSRYNIGDKQAQQFRVPPEVSEISGLAMTSDGRLFCHDDESGIVYQLDHKSGKIVKRFSLGSGFLKEDFEGIAIKNDTFFLVASNGNIFEFHEGADRGRVTFIHHRTSLTARNDVEGLEYDPETNCLLLACKGYRGKGHERFKAVYAFSLARRKLLSKPRFLIPIEVVKKKSRRGQFNPSGIAKHPLSGTFFIISADGESIIEINKDGKLLDQAVIPGKVNRQPEGIAFAADGTMFIANDGQGGSGTLTVYPMK